jgi:hypothetical protein
MVDGGHSVKAGGKWSTGVGGNHKEKYSSSVNVPNVVAKFKYGKWKIFHWIELKSMFLIK